MPKGTAKNRKRCPACKKMIAPQGYARHLTAHRDRGELAETTAQAAVSISVMENGKPANRKEFRRALETWRRAEEDLVAARQAQKDAKERLETLETDLAEAFGITK